MSRQHGFCVVGVVIVAMATAMLLLAERPGASLLLLAKEEQVGRHQTSRNSDVIHSGVYYEPGSSRRELCRRGAAVTREFRQEHGVPFELTGKLLVATSQVEMATMDALEERSVRNGLVGEPLSAAELHSWEPNVAGLGALHPGPRVCRLGRGDVVRRALGARTRPPRRHDEMS